MKNQRTKSLILFIGILLAIYAACVLLFMNKAPADGSQPIYNPDTQREYSRRTAN